MFSDSFLPIYRAEIELVRSLCITRWIIKAVKLSKESVGRLVQKVQLDSKWNCYFQNFPEIIWATHFVFYQWTANWKPDSMIRRHGRNSSSFVTKAKFTNWTFGYQVLIKFSCFPAHFSWTDWATALIFAPFARNLPVKFQLAPYPRKPTPPRNKLTF